MFTLGRTILVAALALVALGAGPAMAKPGGAGPGATDAIEVLEAEVEVLEAEVDALETRVETIEDDTPGGVGDPTDCAQDEIAKFDTTNGWECKPDDTGSAATSALATRVTTIENATPGGVGDPTACAQDEIAKFDTATGWDCAADVDTTNTAWGSLTGVPTGFADDTDDDTLGTLPTDSDETCDSGDVPEFDGTDWNCRPVAGGGGSPFTLTDQTPDPVGTVIGIDMFPPMKVITLLTDTHIAALSGREIVLAVTAGDFARIGGVFWDAINCDEGFGVPHVEANDGFLDTIHPAAVVKAKLTTTRLLYVAKEPTVFIASLAVDSIQTSSGCQNAVITRANMFEADAGIDTSTLFMTPIVLGGGP